ncbi:MAG TPA: FAD-binding oxidoreductase [Chloroflexota bacterium]|nr:FAD-binding oxidoreductase [Chloroflexota bacterium]
MSERADVAIVGGGVIGASVAFHLAERGIRDVLIIERSALGSGSTGRAAGGIRQQFSTELNCRISMLSVEKLLSFEETTGWDPRFRQVGYLFLLTRPEDWALFQRNAEMQRRLGLDVQLLSAHAAQHMVPAIMVDDVLGATFCPTDGHADPTQVCLGYASAARARGVRILSGTTVTDVGLEGGRVAFVETDHGRVEAPLVVDTAGPWSAQIAALAGISIPIQPYRRQLYYMERLATIPESAPMVVDFASSMYFRPEGPGMLLGMTDRSEPSSFNINTDEAFLAMLVEHAVRRVPALEGMRIIRGWAGLYDVTPDANPIIGRVPEVDGFIISAGFSGHGFMHAPAVGQLVAEIIVDGAAHTLDLSPLSLDRFTAGTITAEQNVI